MNYRNLIIGLMIFSLIIGVIGCDEKKKSWRDVEIIEISGKLLNVIGAGGKGTDYGRRNCSTLSLIIQQDNGEKLFCYNSSLHDKDLLRILNFLQIEIKNECYVKMNGYFKKDNSIWITKISVNELEFVLSKF